MLSRLSLFASAMVIAGLVAGCDKADTPAPPKAAETPTGSVPATMASETESSVTPLDTAAQPVDAAAAPAIASATEAEATSKAQELLAQATTYIKENKLDLAEKALAQVDKLKPSLPASFHPQIDKAHGMLSAAKTAEKGKDLKNLLGK